MKRQAGREQEVSECFMTWQREYAIVIPEGCEAAIITFNDNPTIYDGFSPIDEKDAPDFSSYMGVNTNVTSAIRMALDLLAKQKEFYKNNKISYFQPFFLANSTK